MVDGLVASSQAETIQHPAPITAGPFGAIDGGRLLWESKGLQLNGDFLKFGANDPER